MPAAWPLNSAKYDVSERPEARTFRGLKQIPWYRPVRHAPREFGGGTRVTIRKGDSLVVRRVISLAWLLGLVFTLGMVQTDRLLAQEVKKALTKQEATKPEA